MNQWKSYLAEHQDRFVDELADFLRIPSVSSLSEHREDVDRAADWVARRLETAGLENVAIMDTGAHPVVYGDWLHAPDQPTVVIYGHFDVQPADPYELWTSPPFEPRIADGRIYARGASDDKGNMLIPVLAVEALLETVGSLPINVKLFFEGQEEIGSPQLADWIAQNKELLASDLILSADGVQYADDQPALFVGCKGLAGLQIDLVGPDRDLHSGLYGGAVQNPLHGMASLLASMRSADGKIQVAGFFDDVRPLTDEDRREIAAIPYDEDDYKTQLGVDELFGEPGYTTHERAWVRPTLEVVGMWGGFQGEGVKTVLPSEAHAKITCRLAPDQDPEQAFEAIERHVHLHKPAGTRATVTPFEGNIASYSMPSQHPGNRVAAEVLNELYGKEPYYLRIGGTLPICTLFLDLLDVYTVSYAFGNFDENFHSPDEFFRLSSFSRGQEAYVRLLERLGETGL